jgi:hypothetical protein
VSVHLEIVLLLTQDTCTFCANISQTPKSVQTRPMELLSDVGDVESRFYPFGDNVSVDARRVHGLC